MAPNAADADDLAPEFGKKLSLGDDGQRSSPAGEPPALQITRITGKPSQETVGGSKDLAEDAALRALILNLDASERLSIEVDITDVNEFSGLATLSISKVSFVEKQIENRKPHFVGLSEVKNKGENGAEGAKQLLELLSDDKDDKGFGYLSVEFQQPDEFLIHGWDSKKYEIDDKDPSDRRQKKIERGDKQSDGSWGYGHRYIWTRLVRRDHERRDHETKTFILVTCHMPKKNTTKKNLELVKESWRELMEFIGGNKDVPILLMGDTNKSWQRARGHGGQIRSPKIKYSELEKVLGFQNTDDTDPDPDPVPYPHLALINQVANDHLNNPATTKPTSPQGQGSSIDNFIFFYKDGEKHDDHFQRNYRVHYHRLGWTSHHVLVFEFNKSLLEYK